ncbi:uncharacterized protein LOC120190231 [Hibiscus syriacus]|uniref:uncharacterized protein LOC120190231 n=1 Tax=Hibiscus syriacus TaxID=106335 RepID=UPI0019208694|nr:uncharacterized protein LOC120190231 [Hibiscus syriacus]
MMKEMSASERKKKFVPRVCIFGGKAFATYVQAKRIVKFIADVDATINNDPDIGDLLKVIFVPDYNVSVAELLIPASELSQNIRYLEFIHCMDNSSHNVNRPCYFDSIFVEVSVSDAYSDIGMRYCWDGGKWNQQYEVCDERLHSDWDLGWCQCRNTRRLGKATFSSSGLELTR